MKAPFPYFGGKSRVADVVWRAIGDVPNYVEPFAGSAAVLLARPHEPRIETINDADGYVANFWRALQSETETVAEYADWPVNENDLHARHAWLVARRDDLVAQLEGDPDFYDAKIAGWWVWGMACWIGGGFCSGQGPWRVDDGRLVRMDGTGQGVRRRRVHLSNAGRGVQRRMVHLGDAAPPHRCTKCGDGGCGLLCWMHALADRLRRVRVCCGDWSRVCGPTPTYLNGLTGVFLDPPYSADAGRDGDMYTVEDLTVAHSVREWAVENGKNPLMRIVLCGYEGEHDMPPSWRVVEWSASGGYARLGSGRGSVNRHRERLWLSPHCASVGGGLFDET